MPPVNSKSTPVSVAKKSPVTRKVALSKQGGPVGGISQAAAVKRANRWRENYNPLRGLIMSRVVTLLEEGEQGRYADLQWLFRFVEKRDPVLRALVRRRRAALAKLDWEIKVVSELPPDGTEQMAEAQKETLRTAYEFVDNLREAISFLALAEFRGYAHVQKHYADGEVRHLECLPQWNWIRDGLYGDWFYNGTAQNVTADYLRGKEEAEIDLADFIIREVEDPIDEIGVIAFVRKNLSQKDWDAFVEIFGIPGCVVIGPPNVPAEKEGDYQSAAESVAEGASGYLPNGADAKFADSPRGQNPFKEHLDQQNSDLVLAGTGGKLTMLNEATGLGSGNADAHDEAFDDLAIEEASVISELFQKQFDAAVLARHHAGEPVLAYFELCAKDQADLASMTANYGVGVRAGVVTPNAEDEKHFREMLALPAMPKEVVASWKSNPTREPITIQDDGTGQPTGFGAARPALPAPRPGAPVAKPLVNRSRAATSLQQLAQAFADDLQPLRLRLERILDIEDPDILRARLESFRAELPQLLADINADPAAAGTLEQLLTGAMLAGATKQEPPTA